MRLVQGTGGYMHIKPPYKNLLITDDVKNYNSKLNPLTKEELLVYLAEMSLL
jgi:hypothetical protein